MLPAKENPMQEAVPPLGWEGEFERWLAPFLATLNRGAQRRWAPVYLKGLLLPGERKSVEPLAARVAPGSTEQLHHFIGGSPWPTEPIEAILAKEADRLLGGPEAVLVIDDTALPKQGRHSVGVARQYCGCLGKRANCQVLVSLTLARGEVPMPVGLRLFLPAAWTDDPERCARAGARAGVPEEQRRPLAKTEIALEEIDRVAAAGIRFGRVVTDAGYGISAAFRQGLSTRGLLWAAGIPKVQNVYTRAGSSWRGRWRAPDAHASTRCRARTRSRRRRRWRAPSGAGSRGGGAPRGRSRPSSRLCGCARPRASSSATAGTRRGTRSGSWVSGASPASVSTTSRTYRPGRRSRPWPR